MYEWFVKTLLRSIKDDRVYRALIRVFVSGMVKELKQDGRYLLILPETTEENVRAVDSVVKQTTEGTNMRLFVIFSERATLMEMI